VGELGPASVRSLDAKPGSYDVVVGTGRCEVWEVTAADTPEPLLQVRNIGAGAGEDLGGTADAWALCSKA
jgi:hypothetical protein